MCRWAVILCARLRVGLRRADPGPVHCALCTTDEGAFDVSNHRRRLLWRGFLSSLILLAGLLVAGPAPTAAAEPYSVLVFSKTAGFRHDSIPAGIAAITELGAANGFSVTATEDATAFNDANLAQFAT